MEFEKGNFSFFDDKDLQNSLKIAYETMDELQLWGWLRTFAPDSFVFNNDETLRSFSDRLFEKGDIHSGTSFAMTMWHMQFIARKGWDAYVSYVLSVFNN